MNDDNLFSITHSADHLGSDNDMVSLLSASSAIDDDDFLGVIPSNDHTFLDDLIHPSEELLGNKSTHQLVVAAEEGVGVAAASPWWITFIQRLRAAKT